MRIYVEDYFENEVRDAYRTNEELNKESKQITKEQVEQFINEQVPTIPYEMLQMPEQSTAGATF